MNLLSTFWREETGQDLIEYTLLIAFIAVLTAVIFFGGVRASIGTIVSGAQDNLNSAEVVAS